MMRAPARYRLLLLFSWSFLALTIPALAATPEEEIAYLLARVENSGLVFVRNGKEHSSADAAEHLRRKKAHFQEDIKTAEDFIRLAASQSLLSGQAYQVKKPDGRLEECSLWLQRELESFRTKK